MHETRFSFIAKIFKGIHAGEVPIVVNAAKGWRVEYPTMGLSEAKAAPLYFSVAAHKVKEGHLPKRGKQFFSSAHVFVLDDVGTKAPIPTVPPSYVLETSEGNFQYGYLIHPYPYSAAYETGMRALADAGMTDGGSVDPVHLFRLPGSLHSTGFVSKLHSFDSRRRRDFSSWLSDFGVAFDEASIRRLPNRTRGRPVSEKQVASDDVYRWLIEQKLVTEPINSAGWVGIICPWSRNHTETSEENWSHARYKPGARAFACFHEGCAKRNMGDFVLWINQEMVMAELRAITADKAANARRLKD